jgi:hypothetical protein
MRALLTLIAALLTAWFAVLTFNQWQGDRASDDVLSRPAMSKADYRSNVDTLRRSELLDPGTNWRLVRAAALVLREPAQSQRVAEAVLDREPDNRAALSLILRATRERDPRRFNRAAEQLRRLDPAGQR